MHSGGVQVTGLVGTESQTPCHLEVSPEDRGYRVDENHMLNHVVTTTEKSPVCLLTIKLSLSNPSEHSVSAHRVSDPHRNARVTLPRQN